MEKIKQIPVAAHLMQPTTCSYTRLLADLKDPNVTIIHSDNPPKEDYKYKPPKFDIPVIPTSIGQQSRRDRRARERKNKKR